jgi:biopolymer transport protein TolR
MGFAVGGKRSVVSDPNVVPFIDVLLVLLVIFMLMPRSTGLQAQIPQACRAPGLENCGGDKPHEVVIQVLANGSLSVNQQPVSWEDLDARLREISSCALTAPRLSGAMRRSNSPWWLE